MDSRAVRISGVTCEFVWEERSDRECEGWSREGSRLNL
jgi:hypothetical protein